MGNGEGGVSGEVMFEQRLEVRDGGVGLRGGSVSGRGNSECKALVAGTGSRVSKEDRMAGVREVWDLASVRCIEGAERQRGPHRLGPACSHGSGKK